MKNEAFIFTMDAILAFIPVFIILGTVSTLSSGSSLFSRSFMLGAERIAQDTLEVMSARGSIEDTNITRVNETLKKLLPSYLNYTYELEFNNTLLINISTGNISAAENVMVARKSALLQLYAITAEVYEISHFGSANTTPCCESGEGGGRKEYSVTFTITQDEFDNYEFWLVGEWISDQVNTWWGIYPNNINPTYNLCSCTGPKPNPTNDEQFSLSSSATTYRIKLDPPGNYLQVGQNTLYLALEGNGFANYYIIKTPRNALESTVTPENARVKQLVIATLKIFGGG